MRVTILPYRRLRSIHFISAIVLLWGLSDSIISFYVPIQLQSFLHNLALFGWFFGLSSLVGALSDPILGFISNRIRYTILMLSGLFLAAVVAVLALRPFTIILALLLMAAWGLYYEFIEIAIFSYVSRHHKVDEQSRYFGIIYLFLNVPYVIGPLIGGYLVNSGAGALYSLCLVCLVLAFLLLPRLIFIHRRRERALLAYADDAPHYNFRRQLKSFRKVWRYSSVFFAAALLYNVWDAFVWTLVPLQSIGGNPLFAGLITSAFTLPMAILSGYGGGVADRFGRHAVFIGGLFVAASFTLLFGFERQIVWQVATALVAALGFAFAYPAMMGETSHAGQTHQSELGNMVAVQRLFTNFGFIFGPIVGGYFGSFFGLQHAFLALGAIMLVCTVLFVALLMHFHIKGRTHRTILAEFDL